jgi:4-diphosphocytidyl-2-C-methyl-D-erythritol kinase
MRIKARAKINIVLDVAGKRADGYHELRTVFYETGLCDILDFSVSETPGIWIECTDGSIPAGKDNLVYKAAELLLKKYGIEKGIDVRIEKNIPHGAGLGGGSSDAAAALKAVNTLFKLGIPDKELEGFGARIGADVPFFISGGAAYAEGIGEKLTAINNIDLGYLLIAKPDFGVSTVSAYKALDMEKEIFHPDAGALIKAMQSADMEKVYSNIGNSFEIPVFRMYPEIRRIKEAFLEEGAAASAMSGSGSAVFAVYKEKNAAVSAAEKIKSRFKSLSIFLNNGELLI